MSFLLGRTIFRCYLSFRECIRFKLPKLKILYPCWQPFRERENISHQMGNRQSSSQNLANGRRYCWWKQSPHHLGCIKPWKYLWNTGDSPYINWCRISSINNMLVFRVLAHISLRMDATSLYQLDHPDWPETTFSLAKSGFCLTLPHKIHVWYMDVSENRGTPKSSILIGFSIINHPFCGTPTFGNPYMYVMYIQINPNLIQTCQRWSHVMSRVHTIHVF